MGALALAVLAIVRRWTRVRRGLSWPWLLDVPARVWSATLAPASSTAAGTVFGSIAFASLPNAAMVASVILGAVTIVAIMVARRSNGGRSHVDNGGL